MTTKLIIARHGNTFLPGEPSRRVGITDLPLVESGISQGLKLGAYLKAQNLIPDIIFTSELKRTQQTAHFAQLALQTSIETQTLAIFNEIDYGPDENKQEEDVLARVGATAMAAWESQASVPAGWKVNPIEIINHWQQFALMLEEAYKNKICMVITSNGIARFSPYLTGDFDTFRQQHGIKMATGAVCLFEKTQSLTWDCKFWNVRP